MSEIPIGERPIGDLTDGTEAARLLGCSHDSIREFVKRGRLRAFQFIDGVLVERTPESKTRGKDLLFLRSDLAAFTRLPMGRPRG